MKHKLFFIAAARPNFMKIAPFFKELKSSIEIRSSLNDISAKLEKSVNENKFNEKTEQKELSKWLNKSESDLKIYYGQPDKVEFLDTRNRNYVYVTKKFNIKCERKFELNSKNKIVGFSSKNCF